MATPSILRGRLYPKKLKSSSQAESTFPMSGNVGSGPAPMQRRIAVTPLGKFRPCPPLKPIVLDGTFKSSMIAVTKPRDGFRPGPGSIVRKYHTYFSSDSGCEVIDNSQFSYSDADKQPVFEDVASPTVVSDVASIGNTGASCAALEGSTEQVTVTLPQDNIDLGPCPQHCKSPAEQGAREGDVASSCEGGMAAGELRTGSNSLGFRAAVAHDSEPLSPSPLSAVCCDNFRSPHDPSHADTEVSARAGVTTHQAAWCDGVRAAGGFHAGSNHDAHQHNRR